MADRLEARLARQAEHLKNLEAKAAAGELSHNQQEELKKLRRKHEQMIHAREVEEEMARLFEEDRQRGINDNKMLAESGIVDLPLDFGVTGGTPDVYQRQDEADKKDQPGWLLDLVLGKPYNLGQLVDELGFTPGWRGWLERLERELGANLYGQVAGYPHERNFFPSLIESVKNSGNGTLERFGNWLKTRPQVVLAVWALRKGHLEGLRAFQADNGLVVVDRILEQCDGAEEQASWDNVVRRLAACYEAKPDLEFGKKIHERVIHHPGCKQISQYLANLKQQGTPLVTPGEDRLYADLTIGAQVVPCETPVDWRLSRALSKFQDFIAGTTYQRLGGWISSGSDVFPETGEIYSTQ